MNGSSDALEFLRGLIWTNLTQVGLIVVGAWLLIALSNRFLPWLANRISSRHRLFLLALLPALRLFIIAVSFILIVPRVIEPTFENLVALFGALGLAAGFALKDYASSLFAGIVTLYEAPYRPGDWIKINGAYGEVKCINMRSVEIVTPDDTVVVVPHLKLWNQLIFNANDGGRNLQCVADFYLHPRHDAAQARHMLCDVALTSAFVNMEQAINVVVQEKPWGTHYRIRAYPVDPRHQFDFISDLTVRGKAALTCLDVEFVAMPAMAEMGS